MTDKLDKALDDLIDNTPRRGGRGRGGRGGRGRGRARGARGGGAGPRRNAPNYGARRATPYGAARPNIVISTGGGFGGGGGGGGADGMWSHDLYDEDEEGEEEEAPVFRPTARARPAAAARSRAPQGDVTIRISNLAPSVTEDDLNELFGDITAGRLKKAELFFNSAGESRGTGEITFDSFEGAQECVATYNGVKLDAMAMKLELPGATGSVRDRISGGPKALVAASGFLNPRARGRAFAAVDEEEDDHTWGAQTFPRRTQGFARPAFGASRPARGRGGRGAGRGRGGRGRGGGRGRDKVEKTADDLDKELDAYKAGGGDDEE